MKRDEVMVLKGLNLLKLAQVFSFTLLFALLSQIRIPLPFTPVPLTLQTLGVLFTGYYLGPRFGLLSVLLYLFLGALGLPFFSGSKGGLLVLSGSTGGYLLGFLSAVYLVGWAREKGYLERWPQTLLIGVLAHLFIYLFGIAWFVSGYQILSSTYTLKELLTLTIIPFLPSDLAKVFLFVGFIYTEKRTREVLSK